MSFMLLCVCLNDLLIIPYGLIEFPLNKVWHVGKNICQGLSYIPNNIPTPLMIMY